MKNIIAAMILGACLVAPVAAQEGDQLETTQSMEQLIDRIKQSTEEVEALLTRLEALNERVDKIINNK